MSATSKGMTTTISASFQFPGVPTPLTAPSVRVPATALVAGSPVSCDVGTWTGGPTRFDVRWIRIGTGAVLGTGRTYTLSLADNGARNSLACDVVATNAGGHSALKTSANTVALGIAPTVAIIARPADITESTVASFQLAIGGGGADTVECSIDGGAFLPVHGGTGSELSARCAGRQRRRPHVQRPRVTKPVAAASDTDAWKIVPLPPIITFTTAPQSGTSPSAAFVWSLGGSVREPDVQA